jgi:DNA-binding transcriptional ArsR family regulator
MEPRHVVLDPALLKALAHPLRQRILFALRVVGPSTATRLAERLGESSGLTSYHLRARASAGLVEEVPGRGNGRDRWWRAAHDVSGFQPSGFEGTEAAAAADWIQSAVDRNREHEVATWNGERDSWPRQWRDVADRSDYYFVATPDEARALLEALHDVLLAALGTTVARRDGHEPVPVGAEHVRLHLLAFPVREVAGMRLSSPDEGRQEASGNATERADGPHA